MSPMRATFDAISKCTEADQPRLFEVWESSVRATHAFLAENDIQLLIPLTRAELAKFSPIYCLRDSAGELYAFLGASEASIEMLFVHGSYRGAGAGRLLTEFAVRVLHATRVDVNEENEQAIGFYRHLGFRQTGRSSLDSSGNPFPLLHLELPVAVPHLRIARPVSDLARSRAMYVEGLGLHVVGSFESHQGFDGVMLGMVGAGYHFEFTHCAAHPIRPSPTPEDLTIFYLPTSSLWQRACADMLTAGFKQVTSLNPYWDLSGRTYEDHDGYRVVLQNDEWSNTGES
jgi:putative acetyltransferase